MNQARLSGRGRRKASRPITIAHNAASSEEAMGKITTVVRHPGTHGYELATVQQVLPRIVTSTKSEPAMINSYGAAFSRMYAPMSAMSSSVMRKFGYGPGEGECPSPSLRIGYNVA